MMFNFFLQMTEEGEITEDVLKHMPEDLAPRYPTCKEVKHDDLCEKIYLFFECVFS